MKKYIVFFVGIALFGVLVWYVRENELYLPKAPKEAALPTPEPHPNPEVTTDLNTFIHPVLNYQISYPKAWNVTPVNEKYQDYDSFMIRTSDYSLSDPEIGYQYIEKGGEIIVGAKDTTEDTIQTLFDQDTLGKSIAQNLTTTKVAGENAIQYDFSYEGVAATYTIFIHQGIYYTVKLSYLDQAAKTDLWNEYQIVLNSFFF